jgi:hypothetical protein
MIRGRWRKIFLIVHRFPSTRREISGWPTRMISLLIVELTMKTRTPASDLGFYFRRL